MSTLLKSMQYKSEVLNENKELPIDVFGTDNNPAVNEEQLLEWFEWFSDHWREYPKFEHVGRADLYAFNLLDSLLEPSRQDMVEAANHDVIYLNVTLEDLVGKITPDDVRKLHDCGVHIGDYGLEMFV